MANSKKKKNKNGNKIVIIVTAVFAILGTVLCVIGNLSTLLVWLRNCGIAFLIMCLPFALYIAYKIINAKIKEM